MIVDAGDTVTRIDEEQFMQLSDTTPLRRFNDNARRLLYRWYEQAASRGANHATFDPYDMTRAWREVDGQTLAKEYALPGERSTNDATAADRVLTRLRTETVVLKVGYDDYLVLDPCAAPATGILYRQWLASSSAS